MFLNFDHIFNRFFSNKQDPDHFVNSIEIAHAEPDQKGWIRIVPIGEFPEHHNGAHVVTKAHINQMAQNFKNSGTDLLFDIDHASMFGNTKAAAWAAKVQARDDGLYIKYPDFTPDAEEAIQNREYRYFSPVYYLDKKGKQGELLGAVIDSVAITNRPYLDTEIDHIGNNKEFQPSSQSKNNDMKLNKESLEKLGLDEDATQQQVNEALANADLQTSGGEDEKKYDTSEKQDGLEKKVNSLEEKLAAREQREKQERVGRLINAAIDDGKINPADKAAWINSAKADFEATKEAIDARKKNSAMPSGVTVDQDAGSDEDEDTSAAFRNTVLEKTPELAK